MLGSRLGTPCVWALVLPSVAGRDEREPDGIPEDVSVTTGAGERPRVVCLCGSTRFLDAFDAASVAETLAGRIVLNIASTRTDDDELFAGLDDAERAAAIERLGALHFAKIDLADEILVLNVGGYIGASTRAEIDYAHRTGTLVRYLEPPGPSQA